MKSKIYLFILLSLGICSTLKSAEPSLPQASDFKIQYLDVYKKTLEKERIASEAFSSEMGKKVLETFLSENKTSHEEKAKLFNTLLEDESEETSAQSKLLLNFLFDCASRDFAKIIQNPLIAFFKQYANSKKARQDTDKTLLEKFQIRCKSLPGFNILLQEPIFKANDTRFDPKVRATFFSQTIRTNPSSIVAECWMDDYIKEVMEGKSTNIQALFNKALKDESQSRTRALDIKFSQYILKYMSTQIQKPYDEIIKKIIDDGIDTREFLKSFANLRTLCSDSPQEDKEKALESLNEESKKWFCKMYIQEASLKNKYPDREAPSRLEDFMEALKKNNPKEFGSVMVTLANELPSILNNPLLDSELKALVDILEHHNFAATHPEEFKRIAEVCFDNLVKPNETTKVLPSQTEKKLAALELTFRKIAGATSPKTTGMRRWLREYCTVTKIMARIKSFGKNDTKRYEACNELAQSLHSNSTLSAYKVCEEIGTILQGIKDPIQAKSHIMQLTNILRSIKDVTPDMVSTTITNRLSDSMSRIFFIATLDWNLSEQEGKISLADQGQASKYDPTLKTTETRTSRSSGDTSTKEGALKKKPGGRTSAANDDELLEQQHRQEERRQEEQELEKQRRNREKSERVFTGDREAIK